MDFFRDGQKIKVKGERIGVKENIEELEATNTAQAHMSVKSTLSSEERKGVLKQHKLKVTWLNPPELEKRRKAKRGEGTNAKAAKSLLLPHPVQSFLELRQRYDISNRLAGNLEEQGYTVPTEVQVGALPLLLDRPIDFLPDGSVDAEAVDLLSVAPTGSGKTLAFMIPLLRNIQRYRGTNTHPTTSAVILAPTKELVGQIVNEGRKLAQGTGVKVIQARKGMQLSPALSRDAKAQNASVKADILVSTPGLLHSMIGDSAAVAHNALSTTRYLVLDEADVLLDPLFREQTLGVWNALASENLRVSLWSATMGSNIETLARATIHERKQRLSLDDEAPLIRLVVGLKDSAIPNVEHKLIYAATEQGKLMGLRQLLHPTTSSAEAGPPLRPPFLVFTQTIERAAALHSELLYDIPAEAGGISRIAVLHSDLSDSARDGVMTRFRKGEVWVLITTDLLSRGVDFRGINGVVNYDIPTSSAAYIHRVGRTGRAGRQGGVAVTLYSQEDIPYLKHVANVVAIAEKQQGQDGKAGLQQWLLDALPTLSKQDKQTLKKRGIESRTARGKEKDPKAARQAKISTKPGFQRRVENNRRGAVLGSQRRKQEKEEIDDSDDDDEADFGGFD